MKIVKPYVIGILLFVVLSFFYPTLIKGLLPIPSDTIIGLYHPYRDLYATEYPRGIPYKNFLITDPVRQQYPWRYLAMMQEKAGELPLWNPYNMAGTPLLANMQSAPLYPLNIVFFVMPFQYAWTLLVILQPLLAATFLYLYLRHFKIHPLASMFGSIAFVFSGFSIAWLEWNTMLHVVLWLPLILLAKEKLLEKIQWQWIGILIFAEVSAFFGGHLQLLFYTLVISNTYLFIRILQKVKRDKQKHVARGFINQYIPFLCIGVVVFLITAIQWLPTLQLIGHSARDVDTIHWQQVGWFIPWQHLVQFIAPDFFGNPTTLNYWGVWNYAEMVGYIGIAPLLFAFYALCFRRDKKTLFFGMLAGISLLFALPTMLSAIPYQFRFPLLGTSQPTRLLYVVDLSLAILSALGLDYFLKQTKKTIIVPILLLGSCLAGLWVYILFIGKDVVLIEYLFTAKRNVYLPTVVFSISAVLILISIFIKPKYKQIVIILILLVTLLDLIRFGHKFTSFTQQGYLFPSTKVISFLQKNTGNYRIMATDNRILPPNFSAMYKLQSIDGYDPLYLRRYGELIAASERGEPNITPPFGFNRIITPHSQSHIIDLLGVKYVLSLIDIDHPKLKKVFQEGETRVYESNGMIPRAFFIQELRTAKNKQEAMTMLFDSVINIRESAIIEYEVIDNDQLTKQLSPSWSIGEVTKFSMTENTVTIQTKNEKEGFLVITNSYYPTWKAKIDNTASRTYRTDYNFIGIVVPAGEHTITLYHSLF